MTSTWPRPGDALTAIFVDRSLPFEGRRTGAGGIDRDWTCPIPLILIATDYNPYTVRQALPTRRIVWLGPGDRGDIPAVVRRTGDHPVTGSGLTGLTGPITGAVGARST